MRIQVNDEKKLAAIWLTNADRADEARQQELQRLYREYSARKYTVAVFQSGREDLTALTSHLLCHNRVCAAKAELRREAQEREEKKPEEGETSRQIRKRRGTDRGPAMTS